MWCRYWNVLSSSSSLASDNVVSKLPTKTGKEIPQAPIPHVISYSWFVLRTGTCVPVGYQERHISDEGAAGGGGACGVVGGGLGKGG